MLPEFLTNHSRAERISVFMDLVPDRGVYNCRIQGPNDLAEIYAYTALFPLGGGMTEFDPLIYSGDYHRSLAEHIKFLRGLSVDPRAVEEAAQKGITTDLSAAFTKESKHARRLLPTIVLAFGRSERGEVVVLYSTTEFAPDSALRLINSYLDLGELFY